MAIDRRVTIETISRYWRSTTWTDLNGPLRVTARHCVCVCVWGREGGYVCILLGALSVWGETVTPRGSVSPDVRTDVSPETLLKGSGNGVNEEVQGVFSSKNPLFRLNIGIDSIEGKEMRESCKGEYSEWNCIIGYFVLCWNSYWDLKRNCEKRYWKRILLGECGEWLEKILSIILHIGTIIISSIIFYLF